MQKKLYTAIAAALLLSTGGGGYQLNAEPLTALQQQTDICKGIVLDKDGEPLIGASVRVEGTTVGTTTDLDGAFSIKGVKKGATVTVTCIGYASESKTWDGAELYFTLSDDQQLLDEVVVVGYGVQKKANVTGAVSSMKAADIEDRAVASISAAMAGECPVS
ncbi:MAG: carboxypeptidase-like regulatory domain-containing protein [Muribaculaceae bacterium]|nr:carboxypeptidase-like regulatory domain-containing protein [Muribaculaceae bacterium]